MKTFADLRIAIVGYGSIGRRHVDNLLALGVRNLIVVRRATGQNPVFSPPNEALVVKSQDDALTLAPDLTIVCTPTSQHVRDALLSMKAGVPVLIEKPLASTLADAQVFEQAARKSTTGAGLAYCLRAHPAYRLARDELLAGRMGRIGYFKLWFESYLPSWHPWEDYRTSYAARAELGGGILPTVDHELDYLTWCLGVPCNVQGIQYSSGLLDIAVPDTALVTAQFRQGCCAQLLVSYARQDRARGFEIVGARGTLRYCWETQLLEWQTADKHSRAILWDGRHFAVNDMYLEMLREVLEHLVTPGSPWPIPWQSGLDVLQICTQVPTITL